MPCFQCYIRINVVRFLLWIGYDFAKNNVLARLCIRSASRSAISVAHWHVRMIDGVPNLHVYGVVPNYYQPMMIRQCSIHIVQLKHEFFTLQLRYEWAILLISFKPVSFNPLELNPWAIPQNCKNILGMIIIQDWIFIFVLLTGDTGLMIFF